MSLISKERAGSRRLGASSQWGSVWERVIRPNRRAVRGLRIAAESRDADTLASLLDPGVAVVVEAGDAEEPTIRVVSGAYDAIPLLVHGLAARPGLSIAERTVNGQPGLLLRRDDGVTTSLTIDFAGRLVSAVWIRVHTVDSSDPGGS